MLTYSNTMNYREALKQLNPGIILAKKYLKFRTEQRDTLGRVTKNSRTSTSIAVRIDKHRQIR